MRNSKSSGVTVGDTLQMHHSLFSLVLAKDSAESHGKFLIFGQERFNSTLVLSGIKLYNFLKSFLSISAILRTSPLICLFNPTFTPGFGKPILFVHPCLLKSYLSDLIALHNLLPCECNVNVPHTGMHPIGFTQFPNGAAINVSYFSVIYNFK
jgi:hypothetical protein